jgi:hypothetical protein
MRTVRRRYTGRRQPGAFNELAVRWSPQLEVIPARADRGGADLLLKTLQTEHEMAFTGGP